MNLQETIALIGALKEAGATHFKSNDFEVHLDGSRLVIQEHKEAQKDFEEPKEEEGPIDQEKTKKIEDLIDVLNMKDEQLVDQIFPER